ncbi:MAG: hypothetical protein ABSF00_03715 [Candidatus Bathyarchaeia archaeon]
MAVKLKGADGALELRLAFVLKPVPVLGTVVLLGAIVQLILGFVVSGGMDSLVGVHVLFGLVGLALVIVLAVIAFRAKTATLYSKLAMVILTIVVLAQVGLGLQLLSGTESLMLSHEANGFVVVILSLLVGGITFWTAKRKVKV